MTRYTKVVFRKYKDGDIIAIFPQDCGTNDPYTCACYQHMGQHGSCDPFELIQETSLAIPEEYADLKRELESIGYHFHVMQKITRDDLEMRKQELREMQDRSMYSRPQSSVTN